MRVCAWLFPFIAGEAPFASPARAGCSKCGVDDERFLFPREASTPVES
jgi:hypothetical protein